MPDRPVVGGPDEALAYEVGQAVLEALQGWGRTDSGCAADVTRAALAAAGRVLGERLGQEAMDRNSPWVPSDVHIYGSALAHAATLVRRLCGSPSPDSGGPSGG